MRGTCILRDGAGYGLDGASGGIGQHSEPPCADFVLRASRYRRSLLRPADGADRHRPVRRRRRESRAGRRVRHRLGAPAERQVVDRRPGGAAAAQRHGAPRVRRGGRERRAPENRAGRGRGGGRHRGGGRRQPGPRPAADPFAAGIRDRLSARTSLETARSRARRVRRASGGGDRRHRRRVPEDSRRQAVAGGPAGGAQGLPVARRDPGRRAEHARHRRSDRVAVQRATERSRSQSGAGRSARNVRRGTSGRAGKPWSRPSSSRCTGRRPGNPA